MQGQARLVVMHTKEMLECGKNKKMLGKLRNDSMMKFHLLYFAPFEDRKRAISLASAQICPSKMNINIRTSNLTGVCFLL